MSPTKVLIVEDEVIIAHSLARILKKLGYKVVEMVTSGEDAIQAVATHCPDIILMDIVIQGDINGIQAASKIIKAYNLPIIYVTAYTDEETLHQIRQVGGYGFLVKPYKKEQLHAAIQLALGQHQHHEQSQNQQSNDGLDRLLDRAEILSIGQQLFNCSHPSLTVIAALLIRMTSHTSLEESSFSKNPLWIQRLLMKVKPNIEEQDLIGQLDFNEFLLISYMRTPEESIQWKENITQQLQQEIQLNTKVSLSVQIGLSYTDATNQELNTIVQQARRELKSSPTVSTELLLPS